MSTRYVVLRSYNPWSYTTNCQYTINDFINVEDDVDHEKVLKEYSLLLFTENEGVVNIKEEEVYFNRRNLTDRYNKEFCKGILIAEYAPKHVVYGFVPVNDLL